VDAKFGIQKKNLQEKRNLSCGPHFLNDPFIPSRERAKDSSHMASINKGLLMNDSWFVR
jgi:hypothetical protein